MGWALFLNHGTVACQLPSVFDEFSKQGPVRSVWGSGVVGSTCKRSLLFMRKKHLIVIHGRASKPSYSKKRQLVLKSLLHGLSRVSPTVEQAVRNGEVKFSFVYYGDISNRELVEANSKEKGELAGTNDAKYEFKPCEDSKSYDDDLKKLFLVQNFSKKAYKSFLKRVKDKRGLDEAVSVVSAIASIFGLNDKVVAKATPDMGAYLLTRKVGSEIRQRLQRVLKPAIMAGDDICLMGHSMGTIVCYDVLWKYSQMSEYKKVQEKNNPITLWLTLGCPLGEPGVQKNLYDSNESLDGKYPKDIIRDWVNYAAVDDFVSHDSRLKNDYSDMLKFKYVNSIRDDCVYNFWEGSKGANAHKFYGYLDNPKIAKCICEWVEE